MDYAVTIILAVVIFNYLFAFYVKYWYVNKHTKDNLVERYVELQRIRKNG